MAGEHGQQQAQKMAVENQPEQVLADPFPQDLLFPAPGAEAFQNKDDKGSSDQPEVVLKINGHGVVSPISAGSLRMDNGHEDDRSRPLVGTPAPRSRKFAKGGFALFSFRICSGFLYKICRK